MKFFASTLLAAMAGLASAEQMFDLAKEVKTYKSHFGAIVEEHSWDNFTKKNITFPSEKFMADYAQQAEHINNMTKIIQAQKNKSASNFADQPIYSCASRTEPDGTITDPFEFLPVYAGEITPENPLDVYTSIGKCF